MKPRFWHRPDDDQYILLTEEIDRPVVDVVVGCLRAFCIACIAFEIIAIGWGLP